MELYFAVYEIRRQNILVAGPKEQNEGQPFQVATGEQRARGFETDIKGEIIKGLNIIVNYAYTDAKPSKTQILQELEFSLREMQKMFRITGSTIDSRMVF